MKKSTSLLFISFFVLGSIFSISYLNSHKNEPRYSNVSQKAHADWPYYDIDEMISNMAELIVMVKVTNSKVKKVQEGDPEAKLSTLKVLHTYFGHSQKMIILDQTLNYVHAGNKYVMFLKKTGDYYYEVDGNSIIKENDNYFKVKIPGFKGKYTEKKLEEKWKEKLKKVRKA